MNTVKLIQLGSRVFINLSKAQDRIPSNITKLLDEEPYGMALDYRMNDGGDIGLILELKDGSKSWFFSGEVELISGSDADDFNDKKEYFPHNSIKVSSPNGLNNQMHISVIPTNPAKIDNILGMLNPFNFFHWLSYSLKDIL